jgi:beta-lactamase superfamily II metal-dependent hydrolase
MRKALSKAIIATFILTQSLLPSFATNISIDGQQIQFNDTSGAPFIDQANRTQVPFRQTMEAYGCAVSWDAINRVAIAEKDGITVRVPIGASYIIKDGRQIQNDTAALIKDNRTYLPIRAVLEAFGADVGWDNSSQTVAVYSSKGPKMTIHFIEVGQADSILIDFGNYEALIDAGNNGDGALVVNYIKPYIDGDLDLIIATHAHEDHIGGLDDVIEAYQVDEIIDSGDISDTATFNDYITAVSNEPDCKDMADEDMIIDMGSGAKLKIVEALEGDSNLNNDSVIALLDYNNFEALFPGDSESAAEAACLSKLYDVDVLKAGHHGSQTASTQALLNVIRPEIVIISAGIGNSYGHPHYEALQRFASIGASAYGTFRSGTIVLTTYGNSYSLNTSSKITLQDAGDKSISPPVQPIVINQPSSTQNSESTYIGNSNTMKFHKLSCSSVPTISPEHVVSFTSRSYAINAGYIPCKRCNP